MSKKGYMNRKQVKYKKRLIIIVLIICLIIITILLFYLNKLAKTKEYEESIKEFQEFRAEYEAQTILPRKIYELYNYDGEYDRDFLYKNMKKFVDYLGYLKENVTQSNSIDFYNKNKEEILNITGIDSVESFQSFAKKIEEKNVNIDEFKYAEIEAGSSYEENGYYNFVLYLYYGENNELSEFYVAFANSKNQSIPVIYKFVE